MFELVRMLLQILARHVCLKRKAFKKKKKKGLEFLIEIGNAKTAIYSFLNGVFFLSMLFSLLIILILLSNLAFQFLNLTKIAC